MEHSEDAPLRAYDERLSTPATWWWIALGAGFACALIMLWFGPVGAAAGFAVGTVFVRVLQTAYGSARITVTGTDVLAGRATVPLTALGTARALDAEEARALRMERADPRAFMLLRSYIPTAVVIEVTDPEDPTPYLYLSTRRPEDLVEVLGAVRALGSRVTGSTGDTPA